LKIWQFGKEEYCDLVADDLQAGADDQLAGAGVCWLGGVDAWWPPPDVMVQCGCVLRRGCSCLLCRVQRERDGHMQTSEQKPRGLRRAQRPTTFTHLALPFCSST
jgi:hypothetical protein